MGGGERGALEVGISGLRRKVSEAGMSFEQRKNSQTLNPTAAVYRVGGHICTRFVVDDIIDDSDKIPALSF